jgi:hypothetical protein
MKLKSLKSTLTAAMLTLVATAAYGQTNALIAKIPFAFRAVGSDLPAGQYRVVPAQGSSGSMGTMELRNLDTGKTVFISSQNPIAGAVNGSKKDVRPRLVFQCGGEEGCSLATLWSGAGSGLEFATPALTASQKERRETIYLDRFKEK